MTVRNVSSLSKCISLLFKSLKIYIIQTLMEEGQSKGVSVTKNRQKAVKWILTKV